MSGRGGGEKHMYIGVNYTGEISEQKYKTMNE